MTTEQLRDEVIELVKAGVMDMAKGLALVEILNKVMEEEGEG